MYFCYLVSNDAIGILPLKVLVPLTDWKERYNSADWMVKIEADAQNGLTKTSVADCFQVRSLSNNRFSTKIGTLTDDKMKEIETALATVLKIEP